MRFLRTHYRNVETIAALGLTDAETGGSSSHAVRFRDRCAAPQIDDRADVSHGVAWVALPPGVLPELGMQKVCLYASGARPRILEPLLEMLRCEFQTLRPRTDIAAQ